MGVGVDPQVQGWGWVLTPRCKVYHIQPYRSGEATVYSDTRCQVLYYTFGGGAGKHLGAALHPPPPKVLEEVL